MAVRDSLIRYLETGTDQLEKIVVAQVKLVLESKSHSGLHKFNALLLLKDLSKLKLPKMTKRIADKLLDKMYYMLIQPSTTKYFS